MKLLYSLAILCGILLVGCEPSGSNARRSTVYAVDSASGRSCDDKCEIKQPGAGRSGTMACLSRHGARADMDKVS